MGQDEAGQKDLVVYDIASAPPKRTYAPNPWKARLALNFKSASYSTNWVELPDVTATRKSLGVPASRHFPTGEDFFTLPVLYDRTTDRYVGDSFDIALYLDSKYPDAPRLIDAASAGVTKAWNDRIDDLFTRFVSLGSQGMPLNPENAEECRRILLERGNRFTGLNMTWEDICVTGEKRTTLLAEFKAALGELVKYYTYTENKGPFLNGQQPTHADFIVGGWFAFMHETLPAEELDDIHKWHDGRWGNLWKGLAPYTKIV